MTDLQRDLDGMRAAHALLDQRLGDLSDADVRRPSLLPDWTVGHVLTHIARNGDGFRGMIEAAGRGEVAAMYPGGAAQRNDDIAAGAARPAAALVDDVRTSAAALEAACAALADEAWASGSGVSMAGPVPIGEVPGRRWREVTVHHADLGVDYSWSQWPAEFVRMELPRMTAQWASRQPDGAATLPPAVLAVPEVQRLAWLFGRAEIDGVGPAGAM